MLPIKTKRFRVTAKPLKNPKQDRRIQAVYRYINEKKKLFNQRTPVDTAVSCILGEIRRILQETK